MKTPTNLPVHRSRCIVLEVASSKECMILFFILGSMSLQKNLLIFYFFCSICTPPTSSCASAHHIREHTIHAWRRLHGRRLAGLGTVTVIRAWLCRRYRNFSDSKCLCGLLYGMILHVVHKGGKDIAWVWNGQGDRRFGAGDSHHVRAYVRVPYRNVAFLGIRMVLIRGHWPSSRSVVPARRDHLITDDLQLLPC